MRFEIIFVRHAESCANVWQDETLIGQAVYKDPEITERGKSRSIAKYRKLKEIIKKYFPSYTIGSSSLLRAQQTAYYMLAKHVKKPINIIPHLREEGFTLSNLANDRKTQLNFVEKIEPKMVSFIEKGKDARDKQTITNKSHFPSFLKWAEDNLDFFAKGKDGVYRSVIFTHGLLLRHVFPLKNALPEVSSHHKYNNNDFIVVSLGDKSDSAEIPHRPNFLYFDTSDIKGDTEVEKECPGMSCRIPISCKKGGRTIRHTRSKNHTIRLVKS